MIRSQFSSNNQQQRQIYPNQLANAAGFGAPPVDMSHLTAEERAMIQSVMAKAEMVTNNSNPPGTNSQTQMAGQAVGSQQQRQPQQNQHFQQQNLQCQPNMQQIQPMAGAHQQQRQIEPMSGASGPIRMQTNPNLYNAQQPQQLAFQWGGSQMSQQADSSRGQLPALEQRTLDLVSQINNQFNLNQNPSGSASTGSQAQRFMVPQPARVMTAIPNHMSQPPPSAIQAQGASGAATIDQERMAMQNQAALNQAQSFPQSSAIGQQQQQQMLNANQQVSQCGGALMPFMFNQQYEQKFGMNPSNVASNQNLQPINPPLPVGMLPNQTLTACQFVAPYEQNNPMVAQQQQLFHDPRSFGAPANDPNSVLSAQSQLISDERRNIKFRHGDHVFSDQENCDLRGRANRRTRSAKWSRFNSAELADEIDLDRERAPRRRHEPARRSPSKRDGQSRSHQKVAFAQDRGCSSDRARHWRAGRYASNLVPSSSESSFSDENISSASSGGTEPARSKLAERRQLPKPSKNEGCLTRSDTTEMENATNKTSKLLSELKLNEQANQMMEQQQLLIKQSQELIKLQQAQLEQQAKRPSPTPDEGQSSSVAIKSDGAQPTSKQVKTKCALEPSETRDVHETDSSIDSDQLVRQIHVRAEHRSYTNSKGKADDGNSSRLTRNVCSRAESPTNTTGSDPELLASLSRSPCGRRNRRTTRTSRHTKMIRESPRAPVAAGFTPSPLPVEAAVQLHHLQAQQNSEARRGAGRGGDCGQQRVPRSRVELLRSRSVCNSPQGLIVGRIVGTSSPDCNLSEFAQRLAQRKLLPDPPANAVPLTPSMVRKMVETQRVAATSSCKLPTSINAQSTLLTNNHSYMQPLLDLRPSSMAISAGNLGGYQCDQLSGRSLKPVPKSIGSYTARINGAQVSFGRDQSSSSAAIARYQRLRALSRADLNKFLDFTSNSSILKSSPQRMPRARDVTGRILDEQYYHSPSRSSGWDHPTFERFSQAEKRVQAYRDDRLSSRSTTDRYRRNSEGDDNFGSSGYRSRLSTASKHVNFENNHSDHFTRANDYLPSLSSSMPNRLRSSHLSDSRLLLSPQRYEGSSQQILENRLSRAFSSSIDSTRLSADRGEWSSRSSLAINPSTTYDRTSTRYNISRLAHSDYEPTRYTSSSLIRNLGTRCPYKQRSLDNS